MESIQSTSKTVTIRILRYKPNRIDPPRYQDFSLHVEPEMSVLDALEKIRLEQDNTLMLVVSEGSLKACPQGLEP